MIPTVNALPFGDAQAAVALAGRLTRLNAPVNVVSERMLSVAAIRTRNVFLIGAPEESGAARKLLERAELTATYAPAISEYVIASRGNSEPLYAPTRDTHRTVSAMYGLITVLPSEGAADNRTVVFSSG